MKGRGLVICDDKDNYIGFHFENTGEFFPVLTFLPLSNVNIIIPDRSSIINDFPISNFQTANLQILNTQKSNTNVFTRYTKYSTKKLCLKTKIIREIFRLKGKRGVYYEGENFNNLCYVCVNGKYGDGVSNRSLWIAGSRGRIAGRCDIYAER